MARRGKGVGAGGPARGAGWGGPANGAGWGGSARGIGHNSARAAPFEAGNQAAEGEHSYRRSEQRRALLGVLSEIAFNPEMPGMLRVRATTAALNILEGPCKPMVR